MQLYIKWKTRNQSIKDDLFERAEAELGIKISIINDSNYKISGYAGGTAHESVQNFFRNNDNVVDVYIGYPDEELVGILESCTRILSRSKFIATACNLTYRERETVASTIVTLKVLLDHSELPTRTLEDDARDRSIQALLRYE